MNFGADLGPPVIAWGGGLKIGPLGDQMGLKVAYEVAPLLGAVERPGSHESRKQRYVPSFSLFCDPGRAASPRRVTTFKGKLEQKLHWICGRRHFPREGARVGL